MGNKHLWTIIIKEVWEEQYFIKNLINTLRTHQEWQPLPLNQTGVSVSQKQGQHPTSFTFLLLSVFMF